MNGLQFLFKLPTPLLTVYLNTRVADVSHQTLLPPAVSWIKNEGSSLIGNLPSNERDLLQEHLQHVEEFLRDRTPEEKSLAIFAGPRTWQVVPLHVEVENELHWGKPAISQLLWLAAEHRAYCLIEINHSGVRFFRYRLGDLSELQETRFDVDVSQWKRSDLAHVARDVFDHRMEAQYKRLCLETATHAMTLYKKEHFSAIFLIGPQRLISSVASHFPAALHEHVVLIAKDLGKFEFSNVLSHVAPRIQRWEFEHEMGLVNELLDSDRGTIRGIDETLAQLQEGKVHTLVLSRDLDACVHQCSACGWVNSSADPICSICGGARTVFALRDLLPDLVVTSGSNIEVVGGGAARKLAEFGGIGAWLRLSKQNRLGRATAHAASLGAK